MRWFFSPPTHWRRHITGQVLVIAGGMEGRRLWEPGEINPKLT